MENESSSKKIKSIKGFDLPLNMAVVYRRMHVSSVVYNGHTLSFEIRKQIV